MAKGLMIFTIVSIWISVFFSLMTVFGAIKFLLKNLKPPKRFLEPLKEYPLITVVVPAHNEEIVIKDTVQSILRLNYPVNRLEFLVFADNCTDNTYAEAMSVKNLPQFSNHDIQIIERTGTGGKSGVLNDALKRAKGDWLCVYDADAIPEQNALYFLVKKALEDPKRYAAVFGRNKTRNYKQNFLTRCINLEVVTTQRIQHTGLWELFKIGHIPGTNFIIKKDYVKKIGGWDNGALTEDTALSFKIMEQGELIALAAQSEAFQQEPETINVYYNQRKRWAKGNYEVITGNLKHLFDRSNWRIKWEIFYYINTFFWFNCAIVVSTLIFWTNLITTLLNFFQLNLPVPFTFGGGNRQIAAILLVNWALMFAIYLLQINVALVSQYGQATTENFLYSVASYFTYSQLFLAVSVVAFFSLMLDRIFKRDGTKWYKTQRFND